MFLFINVSFYPYYSMIWFPFYGILPLITKKVTEKMVEIQNTVSDQGELEKVMKSVYDIVDAFSNQLLEVSRRQVKLEEKTEETEA